MEIKQHTNDQPTVIPPDCCALVFAPNGIATAYLPRHKASDPLNGGGIQLMRATVLFDDSEEGQMIRELIDNFNAKRIMENRG